MIEDENATYLWVAETVLRKHKRPLRARDLVNYGLEDGLFSDRELSRTPQKSMQARMSLDILANQDTSRFVRTARGQFYLREMLVEKETADIGSLIDDSLAEYVATRREIPPASENVLVIHRNKYADILNFQGIRVGHAGVFSPLFEARNTEYLPRTVAETREDYKQFITYTIIQNKSRVLAFTRGQYNRAAAFLRGARCVGFGGHVTDRDYSLFSHSDLGVRANAAREIAEEISFGKSGRPIVQPEDLEFLGVLNDDSSDVGVRHVALVLRYWVDDSPQWMRPQRGEASINQLRWVDTSTDPVNLSEFEYWSQLAIRNFFPSYLNMVSSYRIVRKSVFTNPHILCVVGAIGSGKSATTAALMKQAQYTQINSGQVMAELLGIPPVPHTPRREFQYAAQQFIAKPDGAAKLAAALAQAARDSGSSKVVIDGIRHPETLAKLKEDAPTPVAVIYVYTPPDVAYEMYRGREMDGAAGMTFREFIGVYNAPVEGKVKYILGDADAILYNWLGVGQYEHAISDMINDLGVGE